MSRLFWKQVYKLAAEDDGFRILVDRLWPRGLKKEGAALDYWAKSIAPSSALRQAYHQGEIDYPAFRANYERELEHNPDVQRFAALIKERLQCGNVTLVYASKEPEHSHLPALRSHIEKELGIEAGNKPISL